MNCKGFIRRYLKYLICVVLLLSVRPHNVRKNPNENNPDGLGQARCVIALGDYINGSIFYSTGFNYEMLRRAADLLQYDFNISLGTDRSAVLDNLEAGGIDIAVLPAADSSLLARQGLPVCTMMKDSTVWIASPIGSVSAIDLNKALSAIRHSDDYKDIVDRFTPKYEPFRRVEKGGKYKYASPYDKLLKAKATEIGWDWRMLASLVWQESRFRIESRSKRGAEGLLQLMEHTAIAYNGSEERLDPEANLQAGVNYLKKLQRMFQADAANQEELVHFVIAAFNAGEGRIKDCISAAQAKGLPYGTWEDLKAVIPMVEDFKGTETLAHVENTDSLYKAFCIIAP